MQCKQYLIPVAKLIFEKDDQFKENERKALLERFFLYSQQDREINETLILAETLETP